jgi:N-acyl-D-amino-acid deacylase
MHDLVIRNGSLIDGTGRAAVRGDLAIDAGRIVAVGEVPDSGWRTIEADGRLVTPGFIDPHTHLDAQLMWDPLGTPACWHGTTTVVTGNCGVTFAPIRARDREFVARTLESVEEIPAESIMASFNWQWESFGEYLDALAARPLGVNVGGLVGHAATRLYAMGEASLEPDRLPTDAQLATMCEQVDEAIGAGALGFSTSRTRAHATPDGTPIPGSFAAREELLAVAQVLARQGRGLLQWVAGFGENDRDAEFREVKREVELMGELQRLSGRPVVFSLFTHPLVPTIHTKVLGWADEQRAAGAELRPMFGPRVGTVLVGLASNSAPVRSGAWKQLYELPARERLARLEDEAARRRLLEVKASSDERAGNELYVFGREGCRYERREQDLLSHVAKSAGERPVETLVRLLRETRGQQLFVSGGANQVPEHIEEVLDHPATLFGLGDAGAHVGSICDSSLTTHLLTHWCRDEQKFSVEEAVRRLTSDPADAFGIVGRGRLEPGAQADVNVIDFAALEMEVPEFVHDFPAAAGRWTQRARGYDYTLVNGEVVIEDGRHTGRLPGTVLRDRS